MLCQFPPPFAFPPLQVLTNATLGLADLQQTLSAAAAVFVFNIM